MDERTLLRAGPVEALLGDGDLRQIRAFGYDIVQRVYVAVRDRNWGTAPGRVENLRVMRNSGAFSVVYDVIHQQDEIDFRWHATISGEASGRILFSMAGKAHSTFLRNRIGICLHHPLTPCRGAPCRVEKTDGSIEHGRFPEFVSPHQPFRNIRAITHAVAPGLEVNIAFHGDIFEMEDQRNWTDANYKTYSTPLDLPFPVEVKAGTEIHQSVEIRLRGSAPPVGTRPAGAVAIRPLDAPALPLPSIGLGLAQGAHPIGSVQAERLRRLQLGHLRAEIRTRQDMEAALQESRRIGAKLEAAVFLPSAAALLSPQQEGVARWLVLDENEKSTSARTLRTARQLLGAGATLVAGTNLYFAELNRNRPEGGDYDGVCFPVNPQVHAFDDESVMQNAAAQGEVVVSARRFAGDAAVFVSPVTLRPRFFANATGPSQPPPPDPRQTTGFCAAWTVASLKYLCEAGAAGITYFETGGPRGVQSDEQAYPVYAVFEALAPFAGGAILPCRSDEPSRVVALLLRSGSRRRYLAANLTASTVECLLHTRAPKRLRLEPYGVEVVDWPEESAEE